MAQLGNIEYVVPTPLDLKRYRLFETPDAKEARRRIASAMEMSQLIPIRPQRPSATYHMDYVTFRSVSVGMIGLGGMRIDTEEVRGSHLIVTCMRGRGKLSLLHGDVPIDSMHGVCLAPGDRYVGEFSDDCILFVLRVEPQLIDAHAGRRGSHLNPVMDFTQARLMPWVGIVNSIIRNLGAIEMMHADERMALYYEHLFAGLLLAGLGVEALQADNGGSPIPRSVKRAEAFIRKNYAEPLCLDDIAKAANVPTRTLLEVFKKFRQISPMRFLRDVRLETARERLLSGAGTSVAAIAFDSGFGHLGRFAQEYKEKFGESPSETLRGRRGTVSGAPYH